MPCGGGSRRACPSNLQAFDPVHEPRTQDGRFGDGDDIGNLSVEFLEGQPDFQAGKIGAEAEVCAAGAESDLGIRVPADVKSPWVGELSFITVGRAVPHGHFVAGLHLCAAQFGVLGESAAHEGDG